MGKVLGINKNYVIDINPTYKNGVSAKGVKWHSMFITDTVQDATGTYIEKGRYQLSWFGDIDLVKGDKVKIIDITKINVEEFYSKKDGVGKKLICKVIVNVVKENTNNTYNNYNNNNSYNNNYGYSNYNDYNYNDDYGI